ncbi:prostate stem cell antigen-like isoform X4 [Echeneis naucrates]|uniref:Prostate stem cell antigen-like n=1 Tax=Echeneis naucrates TaxID=173247 RepID=A0A665SX43_ECHNA|nr:prostate stem cell antigen-like isoform X4 [Echeneis naucrates]
MRLYGALILFMLLSTACGLKCYTCVSTHIESCTRAINCVEPLNRCFSMNVTGVITKGCRKAINCLSNMRCCEEDMCNSATASGPTAVLLLAASAISTIFL